MAWPTATIRVAPGNLLEDSAATAPGGDQSDDSATNAGAVCVYR